MEVLIPTEEPIIKEQECKSCGNSFTGLYCNLCGEKVLQPTDRSFRTFLTNVQFLLTFTDNKFLKSLKLILLKPGYLSREYAEGRRVNYIKPIQLFFILNLIYFLFPLLQLFNTSLKTQMYLRTHSPMVRDMVREKLSEQGYSYQAYELMYNEKSTGLAKLLIIIFVFLASLPFNVIFKKRNRYFTDHITLSVEIASFNLAMNAILLSLFLMLTSQIIHLTHTGWEKYLDDTTLTIIFILSNLYFLVNACKIFYSETGVGLIIKVVFALIGLFIALEIYRIILFLLTFYLL